MYFCNKVKNLMTICHIYIKNVNISVIFSKLTKGFEMSLIIKNAESLFERFENSIGNWAEKIF